MIAVIFEVWPRAERRGEYLDLVRDHAGHAAREQAGAQDVAEAAVPRLLAAVDRQHRTRRAFFDRAPLRVAALGEHVGMVQVSRAGIRRKVNAAPTIAPRPGVRRRTPLDEAVAQAALEQLGGSREWLQVEIVARS